MKILILFLLLGIAFQNNLLGQDYRNGDFEPVFFSPDPNIIFPQFKGGKSGLNRYLKETIVIPDSLKRFNNKGVAVIHYTINTKRQVIDVSIDKFNTTMNEAFHKLIIGAIKKSTPWKPGLKNGEYFITKLQISFMFSK